MEEEKQEFFRVQQQHWKGYIRYLIMNEGATVQLELYEHNMWFGGTAFIYALWTDPEHRRKGYASELMKVAENIAYDLGHEKVFLEWDKDNKCHVLDWYHRRGYVDIGHPRGTLLLCKTFKSKENETKEQDSKETQEVGR